MDILYNVHSMKKRSLDIAVISDVHLGSNQCHANELFRYLKSIEPKTLVLNGDLFENSLKKGKGMPPRHLRIVSQIIKMASNGCMVYYVTGNQDEYLKDLTDISLGNIQIRSELVLQCNKMKYLFIHGDIIEYLIKISPTLERLGNRGYKTLLSINRPVNKLRKYFGKKKMNLTGRIKSKLPKAQRFVDSFEATAIKYARLKGFDGVVCGHIHVPKIRSSRAGERLPEYLNSGDWVENLTSLEYAYGRWSIYEYCDTDFEFVNSRLNIKSHYPERTPTPASDQMLKL